MFEHPSQLFSLVVELFTETWLRYSVTFSFSSSQLSFSLPFDVPSSKIFIAEAVVVSAIRNKRLAGATLKILRYVRHVVNKKNEARSGEGDPELLRFQVRWCR